MKDEGSLWGMIGRGKVINGWLGRWLPAVAWMALIFFSSSRSSFPDLGLKPLLEELLRIAGHFGEYAVLALLVSRAIALNGERSTVRITVVLMWCFVYAIGDEWHQSFVPGRNVSAFDLVIDMSGAVTGCKIFFSRMKDERAD